MNTDPTFLTRLAELGIDVEEQKRKWMPADRETYDVAMSFASEDRDIVETIATMLRDRGIRVFYDKFEEAQLWGKDLFEHLADIYSKRATFCIVFASDAYINKKWTSHERRHAQARALEESREYILPIRIDDTAVPGIPPTTAYLDVRKTSEIEIVNMVIAKLSELTG